MQPRKIPDAVRRQIIGRAWDGETFARIARDLGGPAGPGEHDSDARGRFPHKGRGDRVAT